jgi:putative transposase
MQLEKLRRFEFLTTARLRPHNSAIDIMSSHKRKRDEFIPERNDNKPFWWNDEVEAMSMHLRESPDALDVSNLHHRQASAKQRVKTTSNKPTVTHGLVRLMRIRILPDEKQRIQFHRWFGIHRAVFNKTIDRLNTGISGTHYDHRNAVLKLGGIFSDNVNSPCDLRQAASHAASSAFAATKLSLKAKQKDSDSAQVRHLLKKDVTQQFKITAHNKKSCSLETNTIAFWHRTCVGRIKVKRQRDVERLMVHYPSGIVSREVIVHYERPNTYYLLVPVELPRPQQQPVKLVMATDPGVRTFHTTYDSNQVYTQELEGAIQTIVKQCKKAQCLESNVDDYNHHVWARHVLSPGKLCHNKKLWRNKRQRMKRELGLLRIKIANIKRDMHSKLVAKWCDKYTDMIVPRFNSSQMVLKSTRKISRKTVCDMMHWGHYNFRQRLISKAAEKGVRVHELTEHYTTKTCGKCGNMRDMGALKIYECIAPGCNHIADRDQNAAFNIFIKNISLALMSKPLAASL